jgi:hypothetical protein
VVYNKNKAAQSIIDSRIIQLKIKPIALLI